jgi:hypothetical protein
VDFGGFLFDLGADDLGGSLASGEDFAAGQVQGGNFRAAANEVHQAFSREGVDYSADACPVDGAGAHGAWLGAGVESVAGEPRGRELPADLGAGEALGVLGGIAFGRHGIIARGDDDLAVLIDDEGAERMSTMGAGCVGELDGLAQESEILFGCRVLGHSSFHLSGSCCANFSPHFRSEIWGTHVP